MVRRALGFEGLVLFDRDRPKAVVRIRVDYRRNGRETPPGEEPDRSVPDYEESLEIDRYAGTVVRTKNTGFGGVVTQRCEARLEVERLMRRLQRRGLFRRVRGEPDDVVETPGQFREYVIRAEFERRPPLVLRGSFDRDGLPDDFPGFAQEAASLLWYCQRGEILAPDNYCRTRRRRSDRMFCGVEFAGGGQIYSYLSDDDSLRPGDFVVVPAGRENRQTVVRVVRAGYYRPEDAPYPVEKAKQILRRCTPEELASLQGWEDRFW